MALDFGGDIRFTFNGTPLTIRGKFEIEATPFEWSVVTNEDGSLAKIGKPSAVKFILDFEDSQPANNSPLLDWFAIFLNAPYNMMIHEVDTTVQHIITGGQFTGRPKIDRLTGATTGVEIVVPRGGYQKVVT